MMRCLVIGLIFSITIIIKPIVSTLVTFTNVASSSPVITQICATDGDPDVCCIPLDLDINDGRHFGWFWVTKVTFDRTQSPDTFAAVYRRTATAPTCRGEILSQRMGNQGWQTATLPMNGAGSALVTTSFSPRTYQMKRPKLMKVGVTEYWFSQESAGGIYTYKSVGGNTIFGRMFGGAGVLDQASGNSSAISVDPSSNLTAPREIA